MEKFIITAAVLAALTFMSALAIELLAIIRLPRAKTAEQIKEWLRIQDSMKFVAAPAGPILLLSAVASAFWFRGWSDAPVGWIYVNIAAFLLVVLLSSTWTPKRFAMLGNAQLAGKSAGGTDRTLAVLWTTRLGLLVGILITTVFTTTLPTSLAIIALTTLIGLSTGRLIR